MFASVLLIGGYYEWASALISLVLLAFLCIQRKENGCLQLPRGLYYYALCLVCAVFLLSPIWAVDRGMAPLGMIKFLPLPLFAVALTQFDSEQRRNLLSLLPAAGIASGAIGLLLSLIPAWHDLFIIDRRLSGTFQYPNSFALFLLAGAIVLLNKDKLQWCEILQLLLLVGGIALSGSRTVFLLLMLTLAMFFLHRKDKRLRLFLIALSIMLIAAIILYVALSGSLASIGRYLTYSLSESTLLGRFLYWRDALPQIAKHPLGLGYLGYYYRQGSFQTGVYSVVYAHNELLQIMLDVGWLPAILLSLSVIRSLFSPHNDFCGRMLLLIICAHSLFDFDLQFISIAFILIIVLSSTDRAVPKPREQPLGLSVVAILMAAVCLWIGTASALYYCGNYRTAAKVYPAYTQALQQELTQAQTEDEMAALAERVLSLNDSLSLAWSAKARVAFAKGNMDQMIDCKQKAISLSRYALEEYVDYFDMLVVGMDLYRQIGDEYSAEYCRRCLLDIPQLLSQIKDSTSSLGWKIDDQPKLDLPPAYEEYLSGLLGN